MSDDEFGAGARCQVGFPKIQADAIAVLGAEARAEVGLIKTQGTADIDGAQEHLRDTVSELWGAVQLQLQAATRGPAAETGAAVILSDHALERIARHRLKVEWIELTVREPDWTKPCPDDATLTRSYRRIEAARGKVLRVVHRPEGNDILIVTAFPDRGARR